MQAAGTFFSTFYTAGLPGAAAAPSPGLTGAHLTSYAGQLPFSNPAGGSNTYLSRFSATCTSAGALYLCDRLWHNSGINVTTTTGQTVTSGAINARDRNGTTAGAGVFAALEVSAAMGNGGVSNTTLTYTGATNGGSQTATLPTTGASLVKGAFLPFSLSAGDTGVASVSSLVLGTTYSSGTMHLVLYRIIARLDLNLANAGAAVDALTGGFARLYDNTVPFLIWMPSVTTASNFSGQVSFCQG